VGLGRTTNETGDLVTPFEQCLDEMRSQKSRGAGDAGFHNVRSYNRSRL